MGNLIKGILIGLAIGAAVIIGRETIWKDKPHVNTQIEYREIEVKETVDTAAILRKYARRVEPVIERIWIREQGSGNRDQGPGIRGYEFDSGYVARARDVYADSLFALEVNWWSRAPLDPQGYFTYSALVKENEIRRRYSRTEYVQSERTVIERPALEVYLGMGYQFGGRDGAVLKPFLGTIGTIGTSEHTALSLGYEAGFLNNRIDHTVKGLFKLCLF